MVNKKITIKGIEYLIIKTQKFKTSYGYAGSNGIEVFKIPENHRIGRFDSIADFREYLGRRKK